MQKVSIAIYVVIKKITISLISNSDQLNLIITKTRVTTFIAIFCIYEYISFQTFKIAKSICLLIVNIVNNRLYSHLNVIFEDILNLVIPDWVLNILANNLTNSAEYFLIHRNNLVSNIGYHTFWLQKRLLSCTFGNCAEASDYLPDFITNRNRHDN